MRTFIHSDSPICKKTEDRLGYSFFAKALATAVVDRPCGDGFIAGVQSAWGMGKSSAINLMLETIEELEKEKAKHEKIKIRHYNPWLFSGFEALARGYLSELGRIIEETMGIGTPPNTRKTVEKLVKGGSEMIGGLAAIAAMVASHGGAAPFAASIKSGVSGALNLGAYAIDNRSLDSIREDLSGHLAEVGCKLLVIIDDLDRLQPEELRQVLTLAKTFGNLPNVIHLLVYDREIIDNSLAHVAGAGRLSFREKIVQVELDLPPPSVSGLRAMTFDRLTAMIGRDPPMDQFDWDIVADLAFARYLRSPRDVTRLTNAISVSWPGLKGEVYVPDFFAMELLRHFERPTYELIRQEQAALVGQNRSFASNNADEACEAIVDSVSESRREAVKRVLIRIFPLAKFGKTAFGSRSSPPALSGRRVGDPDGFDAFFRFTSTLSEITVADLRVIAEKLDDREFLRATIGKAMSTPNPEGGTMASRMLNELGSMIQDRDHIDAAPLDVVLQLADQLIELKDEVQELGAVENISRTRRLLDIIIERLPEAERGKLIEEAVSNERSSVHMSAYIAAAVGRDHGLVGQVKRGEAPIVSEEWAKKIGEAVAARIETLAAVNQLSTRPTIGTVLRVWSAYRGTVAPKAFVSNQGGNPIAILDIAFANMAQVTSSAFPFRYRELRAEPERDINNLEFQAACIERHLRDGQIDAQLRGDAERFVESVRRLAHT